MATNMKNGRKALPDEGFKVGSMPTFPTLPKSPYPETPQ